MPAPIARPTASVPRRVERTRKSDIGPGCAPTELLLSLRVTQDHRPFEHDQPFLVAVLVVVRADALAERELIDRPAEHRRPHLGAEAGHPGVVALRVVLLVLDGRGDDVEDLHGPIIASVLPACGGSTVTLQARCSVGLEDLAQSPFAGGE